MEWPHLAWPAAQCVLCFNCRCFSSGSHHLVISSLEERREGCRHGGIHKSPAQCLHMNRVHKRPGDSRALPFPCDKLADRLHSVKLSLPICFCCMGGSPQGEIASIYFFQLDCGTLQEKVFEFYQEVKSCSEKLTCNSGLGCSLKFACFFDIC